MRWRFAIVNFNYLERVLMTREEALEELKVIAKDTDTEVAHVDADDVLCQLLSDLGYNDVVMAYRQIGKWYA